MRIAKVKIYKNVDPFEFNAGAIALNPDDRVLALKDGLVFSGTVEGDVRVEERDPKNIPPIIRKLYDFESGDKFIRYTVENDGLGFCKMQVEKLGILMKLLKVKFMPDENKLIFFYSAEERVDFRELVKILAGRFHLRIEMRQINIRDECKLLGGLGVCGRSCCCNSSIRELSRIQIKAVKNQCQGAAKLAGYCGRLLCCIVFDPFNPGDAVCKDAGGDKSHFYNSGFSDDNGFSSNDNDES